MPLYTDTPLTLTEAFHRLHAMGCETVIFPQQPLHPLMQRIQAERDNWERQSQLYGQSLPIPLNECGAGRRDYAVIGHDIWFIGEYPCLHARGWRESDRLSVHQRLMAEDEY